MSGTKAGEQRRSRWRWSLGSALVVMGGLVWVPVPVYVSVWDFALSHWRMLLTGLVVVGVAALAGSATLSHWWRSQRQDRDSDEKKPLLREIPAWAIWAGIAGLVLVGLVATWWLVSTFGNGSEQDRIKLEAIKLAGSIVVGTGGVAALVLAARRQRVSELDLLHRDRVADDNRHDAEERRATELYTAAAEQLASDKAPVRMAGMYALSRLGNANEELRQTIVNLLCAYLRMPEISIGEDTTSCATAAPKHEGKSIHPSDKSQVAVMLDLAPVPLAALTALSPDLTAQQQQENQVRLTAQRLLTQHLLPMRGEDGSPTNRGYWREMHLDLVGANLHDWDLSECELGSAKFDEARFHGDADFTRTHFHGDAHFTKAHFHRAADFTNAHFRGDADFGEVHFHMHAGFSPTHFHGDVWFDEAHFHVYAMFSGAHFHADLDFREAHFHSAAQFGSAVFDSARVTLDGARARLDLGWLKHSLPTGWDTCEAETPDSCEGQWGALVREDLSRKESAHQEDG